MRAKLSSMIDSARRFGDGNGSGGGVKRGMEAADAEDEVGVVAVVHQQPHLAVEGDEEDARLEQRGEEPDAALVELERADERDLQDDQRLVLGRQRQLEAARG